MNAELWHAIHGPGAAADLTSGVRLRLSGPDAVRYLNGQVTQDVRRLRPGAGSQALAACVTSHKGKLEAWIRIARQSGTPATPDDGTAGDTALLISGPPDLRDFLPARLEKYLIADDCVLEDVTGETALCHLTGRAAALAPGQLAPGETAAACSRFGPPGVDLWTTPDRLSFWLGQGDAILSAGDTSSLEVLYGVPAWDTELTPGLLPPEAGIAETAIDYHKGCYIGQEVISRLRSIGRVNRQLAALVQDAAADTGQPLVEPGWAVSGRGADGLPVPAGTVTRAVTHPLTGHRHLLAFLHRSAAPPFYSGPEEDTASAEAGGLPVRKTLDV